MPCNKTGVELCRSQFPLFNKMSRMSTRSLGRDASHFRRINSLGLANAIAPTGVSIPRRRFMASTPVGKKIKNSLFIPFRDRKQPPLMSFVSLKFLFRPDGGCHIEKRRQSANTPPFRCYKMTQAF